VTEHAEPKAAVETRPGTLILWDIDGTLMNSAGFGWRAFSAAFEEEFGYTPAQIAMAGRTDRAIGTEFLALEGVSEPDRIEAFLSRTTAQAQARIPDFFDSGAHLLPGVEVVLTTIGQRPGIVQTVLTGNLPGIGGLKLAATGIAGLLDLEVAVFGDLSVNRADLVAAARSRAGAKFAGASFAGARTVVVGDTPLDIAAAHAHGARAVAVATGQYDIDQLEQAGADAVLANLADTEAFIGAVGGDLD
jgi:phosphoglycolate phosphatase